MKRIALAIPLLCAAPLAAQTAVVNGRNVGVVGFVSAGGSGSFRMLMRRAHDGTWHFETLSRPIAYTETGRDDWSVYLRNAEGHTMQVDLHTRLITVNRGSGTGTERITEAYTIANGRNVDRVWVTTDGEWDVGEYRDLGGGAWGLFERTAQAAQLATLRETGRDDWSVYLNDGSGATLAIDLHRRVVTRTQGGASQEIYRVSFAGGRP